MVGSLSLRAPDGAPLLLGHEAWLANGHAVYHLPRAWRRECRVFVDQAQGGEVVCIEGTHVEMGTVRCLWVKGLRNATVTIYPEDGYRARVALDPISPFFMGYPVTHHLEDDGRRIVCSRVTGDLMVIW